MSEYQYHIGNMDQWPSIYSHYIEDGGKLPVDWYDDDSPDPNWSDVPPISEGHYWVFDRYTRTSAVLHLYHADEECPSDPLTINVFAIPGLNPDVDSMAGKVLYGPQVFESLDDYGDHYVRPGMWHKDNMRDWPSVFSNYIERGGKPPGYPCFADVSNPLWSPVPPMLTGFYFVFDLHTRLFSILELYQIASADEGDSLIINLFGPLDLNPTCEDMAGKILYGSSIPYPEIEIDYDDWKNKRRNDKR